MDGREGGIDGQMKGHSDEVSEVCVCVFVCTEHSLFQRPAAG